jgi:hypothetical protein
VKDACFGGRALMFDILWYLAQKMANCICLINKEKVYIFSNDLKYKENFRGSGSISKVKEHWPNGALLYMTIIIVNRVDGLETHQNNKITHYLC